MPDDNSGWWHTTDSAPAVGAAAGGVVGAIQQNQMAGQGLSIQQQAYLQALGLLQSGKLSYSAAQAMGVNPTSAMSGVQPDANATNAQLAALNELGQASREGYNVVDKAAINGLMNDVGQQERGAREAALAHIQPGSGQAIAARLSAQQGGAMQANQNAMNIAAGSRQKALAALQGYGNLSSEMRGQSFGEGAARAKAQDAISQFNSNVSQFNAGQQNNAAQNSIQNTLGGVNAMTGAGNQYAQGLTNQGNAQARQDVGIGSAVGNGVAALGRSGGGGNNQQANNLSTLSNNPYPSQDPYAGWTNYGSSSPSEWEGWGGY